MASKESQTGIYSGFIINTFIFTQKTQKRKKVDALTPVDLDRVLEKCIEEENVEDQGQPLYLEALYYHPPPLLCL